jgi:hypothetical protein
MLSQSEAEFVELVLEVGSRALDQDTFDFMIEEGHPVEEFVDVYIGDNLDEVVESLEEKELVYTKSQREILRSTNFSDEGVVNRLGVKPRGLSVDSRSNRATR